ncbi:MAG: efflux RND transporter periplasmic adaptor subunit [Kiritimatiellae bacterium]|nr:efflux RND transporter periplasmic adaptor subunit [Kiritimatiellia bacterium]
MNKITTFMALSLAFFSGCNFNGIKPDGSGTIECTEADIAPQVSGRIVALAPEEGDFVKPGEIIARLDAADYELKRREAKAAVAVARAQLDLLLAGSRDEDIARAREQAAEARALAASAAADLRRIISVYQTGTATQKQMDDATAQAERTKAVLAAAEQNLAKLEKGSREEEIRLAEAQVMQAEARLALTEKAVADCAVTSSVRGVVTARVRENGEFAPAGAPLVTISRLDEVWLAVYIPETAIGHVKLGRKAWVKIDGRPDFFEGKVTYISPAAEFTPRNVQTPDERAKLVYRVKITLENKEGIFKPGLPADGYLANPGP